MKIQYAYTHIIYYRYSEEPQHRISYYCSDSYTISNDEAELVKGDLLLDDEDEFEAVGYVGNDFNSDDYLSDNVLMALNDKGYADAFDNDFNELYCAYIKQVYEMLSRTEQKAYKINIASSLINHLKAKGKNKELVKYILECVGLVMENKGGVLTQLRLIANPPSDDTILKQLAQPSNIPNLRSCLKRMDNFFSFKTEPSQIKIATVFYVFMEKTELLRSDVAGKFETVNKLLSEYYGIPKPTQRRCDVQNYLEKNYSSPQGYKKKPILIFQEKEHINFWNSLR